MGLDLLDIHFRLEKKFRIKILKSDWDGFFVGKSITTLTAQDFAELVAAKVGAFNVDPAAHPTCVRCGYDLHGLPTDHRCPECGAGKTREGRIWSGVCDVLSDVTGKDVDRIRRDSRLKGDLGASL